MCIVGSGVVMKFVAGHSSIHIYHTISNKCLAVACDVTRSKSMLSCIDVDKWVIDVPSASLLSVCTFETAVKIECCQYPQRTVQM